MNPWLISWTAFLHNLFPLKRVGPWLKCMQDNLEAGCIKCNKPGEDQHFPWKTLDQSEEFFVWKHNVYSKNRPIQSYSFSLLCSMCKNLEVLALHTVVFKCLGMFCYCGKLLFLLITNASSVYWIALCETSCLIIIFKRLLISWPLQFKTDQLG